MTIPSRPKTRRFGMTTVQLVIIACLGLVLLGSMGTVLWWMVNDLRGLPAAPAAPTASEPAATGTASVGLATEIDTTITETPTETAVPYESLIPEGWIRMGSDEVEFWVPPTYVGGDVKNDLNGVADRVAAADPDFASIADGLRQDPPTSCWFWALETVRSPNDYQPGLGLGFEDAPGADVEAYADAVISNFTADVIVLKRRDFEVGGYPAKRIEIEATDVTVRIQEAIYIIQDGDRFWYFVCTSHLNDFFERQSEFDQVVRTFRTLH